MNLPILSTNHSILYDEVYPSRIKKRVGQGKFVEERHEKHSKKIDRTPTSRRTPVRESDGECRLLHPHREKKYQSHVCLTCTFYIPLDFDIDCLTAQI
jgi:hypothetical protein